MTEENLEAVTDASVSEEIDVTEDQEVEQQEQVVSAGSALEGSEQDADEVNNDISSGPRSYSSVETASSLSLSAKIEAILFASVKCMKPLDIFEVLEDESVTVDEIAAQIDILVEAYALRQGGFRLESVRGHGYQFRTVPEAGCYMERLFASRPRPLSRAALETLSIVAYRQPVSRADIEHIRGVDSGSIVKNLLERSLIRCVGRNEEVAGKPMVFGTTDDFLAVFRLNSLSDLPPLASFQPPPDMLQSAEGQLDEDSDSELDLEHPLPEGDFVGVTGEQNPDVSEGILTEGDVSEANVQDERLEGAVLAAGEESSPVDEQEPQGAESSTEDDLSLTQDLENSLETES